MAYMHPALVEHLRKRWMRPDAYRFARPGTPEAKPPGYLHPWAEVARQEQAAAEEAKARALAEQDEFEREVLALRHELARIRLEYELRRFQQKYSPDQPRVPAGNRDGGQWTSGRVEGGSGARSFVDADGVGEPLSNIDNGRWTSGEGSDKTLRTEPAQFVIRICMAGSIMITPDQWGNQRYWVEYICADGFSFRQYGFGKKIPAFARDPRR